MQFFHFRKSIDCFYDGCLVVNTLTKNDLHQLFLTHSNKLMLPVGLTIKSKTDQFNKSVGRSSSLKNINDVVASLVSINQIDLKHYYYFSCEISHNRKIYHIPFVLTTTAESDKVNLIKAELYAR